MSPCPPPPPPPVELVEGGPVLEVPAPTLEWLARRDAFGEAAAACYLEADAMHAVTLADLDRVTLELQAAQDAAEGWERVVRRRPSWAVVAGVAVGAAAVAVVGWETVR